MNGSQPREIETMARYLLGADPLTQQVRLDKQQAKKQLVARKQNANGAECTRTFDC